MYTITFYFLRLLFFNDKFFDYLRNEFLKEIAISIILKVIKKDFYELQLGN